MWTVLLTILIQIYPGEVTINGPEGLVRIVVYEQNQYIVDQGQMTIGTILASINLRLELLEDMYEAQTLEGFDHRQIFKEIQFLLSLLPPQFYITLSPDVYQADPVAESINPMSAYDCAVLLEDLEEEPFSDNQLKIIRVTASSYFFLVSQVEKILECFVFEDDRIEAVRILYPQILDLENSYRLFDKFMFSHSKEELAIILH